MNADGDAALARVLHRAVTDLLTWLDEYPDDEVDPDAVASIGQSIDRGRDRSAGLEVATNVFVDLMWWLGTCDDAEVDLAVAVKLQENGVVCLDELSDEQRRRLLEVIDELAAAEQHDGRRYELRVLPFEMGLVDEEPDDEAPPVRKWVRPEDRTAGPPRN